MIKVYSVGAGLGDCFFIEIANEKMSNVIMVDGRKGILGGVDTHQLILNYIDRYKKIDYLIVTHIDFDHIQGVIETMKEKKDKFEDTIVIYNHVTKSIVNFSQARDFEKMILDNAVIHSGRKDYTLYSNSLVHILSNQKRQKFDVSIKQRNYAYLTLLHPDKAGIRDVYRDYLNKTIDGKPDSELVNKNSIAFLLEYENKTLLFTGDGYFNQLEIKLNHLKKFNDKKIDLIKIPHHGSTHNNIGIVSYAKKHSCETFIVTGEKAWTQKRHPSEKLLKSFVAEFGKKLKIYTYVDISEYEDVIHYPISCRADEVKF
ncbi:hypothetical protein [Inconstantimicrobium mannanitabidum]|uniref:Uncharacterized protein n=1 Tax=Inconstantimicrobium mannanitabidum TaxID=1604901 RepID=A0ACB5R6K8_9CLOT|nr:hypothetical protein [Clostridium sp. TW13]GKX64859.1 hypothetical protein rsdtw13_01170 [Clostridium sp. TW13]